jgi:hypothetical protein
MSLLRLDAAESRFFERQLEHIETRLFEAKYPELQYSSLIPTRTGFDEGALKYIYRMLDEVGRAALLTDKSQRFPRVDVKGVETPLPVRMIGDAYGYSFMEIKGAAKAGVPLEAERANRARKAMFVELDRIAFMGDTLAGLSGLFQHASVTSATALGHEGSGTDTTWAEKITTPSEIIADLNAPFIAITAATNGIEKPDTVVLPNTSYTQIASTPYGTNSDKTILQWWQNANPGKTVVSSHYLETAGASSSKRMVVYKRDPDVVELLNPLGFYQFEPRREGAEYIRECLMTTVGIVMRFPKACYYLDGI